MELPTSAENFSLSGMRYKNLILRFLVGFLLTGSLMAGVTGKISGTITEAKSGQPLIGANIQISGTGIGTASDANGQFSLINIPSGTYTVKVTMIGYATMIVEDVVVAIDLTTPLNLEMSIEALGLNEVTVTAERTGIIPDVSASMVNISSDDIAAIPVTQVSDIIGLQAGIEGLSIRGSESRQVGVFIDGFNMNDQRTNSPVTMTSIMSLSDIQVQTGGFNAEYGNLRSGIVNLITKEGRLDAFHGGVTYRYRAPTPKHFDESLFDPNSFFLRPYLDTTVCWTGTGNGEWDAYTQRQYPSFEGWNAISLATLSDDDPENDLTPEGAKRLFEWQHRRKGDISIPDYTADIVINGPLFANAIPGKPRFYFSHYIEKSAFIFPLSRDSYSENTSLLKINLDPSDKLKMTFMAWGGETKSVSPYQWKTTPTGSVLKSASSVANLLNSSSGNSVLFMPGYYSPANILRSGAGFKLNNMMSESSFLEFLIQVSSNRYRTFQLPERDTARTEILPGLWVDEAPYGYSGYGRSGIDGMSMGGWMNLGRDKSNITTSIMRLDYTNQLNIHHQVKTGMELVTNQFDIYSYTESPSMSTWNRALIYKVNPRRYSIYLQDKIEFESFIANVGLNTGISSSNSVVYLLDPYDKSLTQGNGQNVEDSVKTRKATSEVTFSPRLGISHPISTTSKLYFNYQHAFTEPEPQYRFGIQRESNGLVTNLGNAELLNERTISYELGYSRLFKENYLLNIAAYYKDVTQQIGWISYRNMNSSVQYSKAANNNYEDIRGYEFTISKTVGRWVTGFINYTYMVKTSGYFGLTWYYQDPNKQREYEMANPYQSKPHPQPYLRAVVTFHTPGAFGPEIFKQRPLGDWHLTLIEKYKTGSYATYNPDNIPGVLDNVQWKDQYFTDLRLSKSVRVNNAHMKIFLDVSNLLNTRYLNWAGFSDNYDYIDYVESLHFDWEDGSQKGNDRLGEYRKPGVDYQPFNPVDPDHLTTAEQKILDDRAYIDMPDIKSITFLNPRDITFGISFEF